MYISVNWLKDYVNLDGVDIEELINKFTLSCAEVEGVEYKGKNELPENFYQIKEMMEELVVMEDEV